MLYRDCIALHCTAPLGDLFMSLLTFSPSLDPDTREPLGQGPFTMLLSTNTFSLTTHCTVLSDDDLDLPLLRQDMC